MRCWNREVARLLACVSLGLWSARIFAAGGSYLVDDATITPDGHCQFETWVRAMDHGAGDVSAVPACTVNNVEWSVNASRVAGDGAPTTSTGAGVKWVAGDLDKEGHAVGITAGVLWLDGSLVSESLYVPMSVALTDDHRLTLHVNAGARQTTGIGWRALGGLAVDSALSERWHLIAEYSYVATLEKTGQFGARWSLAETADMDFIAGRTWNSIDQRWFTVGLNLSF